MMQNNNGMQESRRKRASRPSSEITPEQSDQMQNNNGVQESRRKRASRPSSEITPEQSDQKRSRREEPLSEEEWLRQELIRLGAVSYIHVSPFLRHEDFTEVPNPIRRVEYPEFLPARLTVFVDELFDVGAQLAKEAAKVAAKEAKKAKKFVKRKWRNAMGIEGEDSDSDSDSRKTEYLSAKSDSPVENYGAPEDDRWYWEGVNATMFAGRLSAGRGTRSVSPVVSLSSSDAEEDEVPVTGFRRVKRRRSI